MRTFLLILLILGALSTSKAQDATSMTVPQKAVAQLEKIRQQTVDEIVIGMRKSSLPAETRPMLNRILVKSTSEFLAITARKPTREAYLKCLDDNLSRISPLVPETKDREQVAEYFQDLMDIVGLESSEGRLTVFVETKPQK